MFPESPHADVFAGSCTPSLTAGEVMRPLTLDRIEKYRSRGFIVHDVDPEQPRIKKCARVKEYVDIMENIYQQREDEWRSRGR